jgi:DNA-binding CsgD family transcriptional regulator
MSPSFSEAQLKQVFPDASVSVKRVDASAISLRGNQIFQLRSAPHISDAITNYEVKWDVFSLSEIGMRYFIGIQREMENHLDRNPVVISSGGATIMLKDVLIGKIVSYNDLITEVSEHIEFLRSVFEDADVVWIVGTPYSPPHFIWRQAKILFGHQAEPLCYDLIMNPYNFEDERMQTLYEHNAVGVLTQIIGNIGFKDVSDKTLILTTPLQIPYITDAPETMLFDWEDLEIAGGLDRLSETIVQREAYQVEYAEMDASWSRERVEFLLGVSASQANRILQRLRGGLRARTLIEVQILNLLADGKKTTAELIDGVQGNPGSVKNELTKLVRQGEIVRVQQGVYDLA